MGDTEHDTVLMAVEDSWREGDHIHIELFARHEHFEETGVPEESGVLMVFDHEPRDWSLLTDTDRDGGGDA